jgi:AcrR family transcriptional regulator
MSENARPRRRYDSSKRRQQAAQTRRRIVDAAARVFVERGYTGATIPLIADDAEVAVETVYRSTTGKAGLLRDAIQATLAGGAEQAELEVEHRPGIQRVIEEADPRRQLRAYAATQPGVWSRVGPLLRVLDEAAGDSELAVLRADLAAQRLHGLTSFAALLADRGELKADLTVDKARDLIWTLCAQANYDALVTTRGWSHTEYREWLSESLAAALLADPRPPP